VGGGYQTTTPPPPKKKPTETNKAIPAYHKAASHEKT